MLLFIHQHLTCFIGTFLFPSKGTLSFPYDMLMNIFAVEDRIHNVIEYKKKVRKSLKILRRKYRHYKVFWGNYSVEKDFHIISKK